MSAAERRVVHVDMDCFFVSVERRRNAALLGKPVVVGADPKGGSGRGVVCAASYEARAYGIHSAMPIQWAYRRCPDAIYLPPDGAAYAEAGREVKGFLEGKLPDLVQASVDEFYGDLTGCERLFGDLFAYCCGVREEIRTRFGLPASLGLATNRLVAKMAAGEAKPDGARFILPGTERAFLAPLPVRKLLGVGPETGEELESLGVKTIGDLARLGEAWLGEKYGWWGRALARRALGLEESERDPGRPLAKSISRDETFDTDSEDPEWILARLSRLVEDACRELRDSNRRARTVTLRLRYADFVTHQRSRTIPPTDLDTEVFATLEDLFQKEYTRRVRARLVGVKLSNLLAPGIQFLAFDPAEDDVRRALSAADRIRDRYGHHAVHLGRSFAVETKGPEIRT